MNVSYKGIRQDLEPRIQKKLDTKFAKLSKLLETRGEREAHVMVQQQRHLQKAEITIQFYDHSLVAEGADGDLFTALSTALDKLEQQAVKQRGRWREKHRRQAPPVPAPVEESKNGAGKKAASKVPVAPKLFRVPAKRRKPITLDEAMLLLDKDRDYLVYHDAESDRISVLVRRRDGHVDLIES